MRGGREGERRTRTTQLATSSRTALRLARSVRDSRAGAPVLAEARAARWAGRSALNDERMLSEMLLRREGEEGEGSAGEGGAGRGQGRTGGA